MTHTGCSLGNVNITQGATQGLLGRHHVVRPELHQVVQVDRVVSCLPRRPLYSGSSSRSSTVT